VRALKEKIVYQSQWLRFCGIVVAVLIVGLAGRSVFRARLASTGPESLEEAARAAEGLGLFCRSDSFDGSIGSRLIVSTAPLTHERAGSMGLREPNHRCWLGTVAVYRNWRKMHVERDTAYSALWGDLLVYGDPDLVERLSKATP
jgi:hypothetical protein